MVQFRHIKAEKYQIVSRPELGHTVKPALRGYLKIDKTKILMTNGGVMKVKSIAESSPWSILQYF